MNEKGVNTVEHRLKIKPEYFEAVIAGAKTVELRSEADRHFDVGDILILREINSEMADTEEGRDDPEWLYTGRGCRCRVTHVLRDVEWLPPGIAALSIALEPTPRPTVQWFARHMESRLRVNDKNRGWDDDGVTYLLEQIRNEWWELCDVIDGDLGVDVIIGECGDVANYALMLADVVRHRGRWGRPYPWHKTARGWEQADE